MIVGGGIAGCAAALAARSRGLGVALIQDRPVFCLSYYGVRDILFGVKRTIILSLLTCFSLVATLQTALGHSAVEPVPRGDQWWQERHANMNRQVAELGARAEVIFIGDSITQGWEGAGKAVWAEFYARRNAINLGISGDRTQHVLWRLENGNLEALSPKAAVVMIGTNNSNGYDHPAGQIADGVTAIVTRLRERLPEMHIVLVAIFPRGENFNDQRGKLLQTNQVLQKLADDAHVTWVDFGHRFVTREGLIPANLMPDFLHLSPEGYRIWAESLEPYLQKVLSENPGSGGTPGDLTGTWTWRIAGPDGNPVEALLELKQNGRTLTGRFARGPGRWLAIDQGQVEGNTLSWLVARDRPEGGTMTYRMSGKLVNGRIEGKAKAEVDGQEIETDWSAWRN